MKVSWKQAFADALAEGIIGLIITAIMTLVVAVWAGIKHLKEVHKKRRDSKWMDATPHKDEESDI